MWDQEKFGVAEKSVLDFDFHRLQLSQAMWLREMQRTVEQHSV
jgi:hypothetical protein